MRLEIDNRRRKISIKFYTLGFGILYASFWKIVTFRFTDYTRIHSRTFLCGGQPLRAGALPAIFRSYAEHESYINMLSSSYTVDLISPFENSTLFPIIEKAFSTLQKTGPHTMMLT